MRSEAVFPLSLVYLMLMRGQHLFLAVLCVSHIERCIVLRDTIASFQQYARLPLHYSLWNGIPSLYPHRLCQSQIPNSTVRKDPRRLDIHVQFSLLPRLNYLGWQ